MRKYLLLLLLLPNYVYGQGQNFPPGGNSNLASPGPIGGTTPSTGSFTAVTGTGVSTPVLTTPATPTITPTCGSACGSTYVYNIVAKDIYGNRTLRSTSGSTAAQNATLSVSNFNTITWTPVTGAYSYDVYIITGGNAPGLIANVLATATLQVIDTGLTVCYADTPLSNDTNQINLSGNSIASDVSINGVLAGMGPGSCTGQSTRFGGAALGVNTSGYMNSAFGYEALQTNNTGYFNTALGWEALEQNTTGFNNTAVGVSTLANNLTGQYNTAVGANALLLATGSASSAFGNSACNATTSGECVGIGGGSFQTMSTATNNTGVGVQSGQYQTGSYNTALGQQAMEGTNGNSSGSDNTALGDAALLAVTSGSDNTAVGFDTAATLTTDTNGTYIGDQAHVSAATGVTNEIAIGYTTTGAGSNTAVVGNASVTDVYMGSASSAAKVDAAGVVFSGSAPAITATGTTPYINASGPLEQRMQCSFALTTSTFTLALSPVNLCTMTLPNAAVVWRVNCQAGWSNPAGTTPTFAVGNNWAQTPSGVFGGANIGTTNAGVAVEGTTSSTSNGNIVATGTLTNSATIFPATWWTTFTGSATSGAYHPTAALTGTSATGTLVGFCTIQ